MNANDNEELAENFVIYLYSNQPIVSRDGQYFARQKNFVDFLAAVVGNNTQFRLVVPCRKATDSQTREWVPIALPDHVVHARYYESHLGAISSSFRNALLVRTLVRRDLAKGLQVLVAGPGPNSFLFWLSLLVPKSARYVFFIRGNTLKTVQHIFRGKPVYPAAVTLVRVFQNRIRSLILQKRAMAFVYGKELKKIYPDAPELVHVITPLIDESFCRTDVRPPIDNNGPLKILYVGRLSKEKNIMALLDAVRSAIEDGTALALRIVGYGALEKEIKDYIRIHGLNSHCVFVGYVGHGVPLAREYDSSDVLCLPSKTEGVPRVVVEAFARRMPVLSTRVGSLPHLFPDEVRYIDRGDTKGIQKELQWAATHRQELSALGELGRHKVSIFGISANANVVRAQLVEFAQGSQIHGQTLGGL